MTASIESWVPAFNTALIGVSGICAAIGYAFIRRRRIDWHRRAMLTATGFAALFLIVYVGRALLLPTKHFDGEGLLRTIYFVVLGSHMLLATLSGPLILVTLGLALRRNYKRHRRLARVALPVWLTVAVTGWVVYLLLYNVIP